MTFFGLVSIGFMPLETECDRGFPREEARQFVGNTRKAIKRVIVYSVTLAIPGSMSGSDLSVIFR
jgi:hypothetical protein